MKTPALIAALFVARAAVLLARPLDWSGELLLASFGQDALVAFVFLCAEAGVSRWRVGRRMITILLWIVVAYVAVNVAVARVLPTPLTWPMVRAAGAPIADSIRLYATWSAALSIALVVLAAFIVLRLSVHTSRRWRAPAAAGLLFIGAGGLWAGARLDTWGLHRNAIVTLVASAFPAVPANPADGDWRSSAEHSSAVDLSALSGIAAGRNVIVIGLESVGAHYLKMFGASENVMRRLDALASHAVVFDRAYAVSPDSIRSLYSVLCSRYPAFDTPVDAYATGPCETLPAKLRAKGYHTALFHSGRFGYLGMTGIVRDRGFDTLEDAGHIGGNHESSFGVDETSTVARVLSWIDALPAAGRFALTYMPVAGHHPYVFSGTGAFGAATDFTRYQSALHEGDVAIGTLIDGLKARGLFEKTMFVVYGDHGQAFGQHPGNVGHTFYLYEENVRVPFLIAIPGPFEHQRRSDIAASLVDVSPTALDLLGLGGAQGQQGQSALVGNQRMALFFTDYGASLVGLRDGPWKFIHDLGSHQSRLFHLGEDPRELADRSAEQPARVNAYVDRLRKWSGAQKALSSPSHPLLTMR